MHATKTFRYYKVPPSPHPKQNGGSGGNRYMINTKYLRNEKFPSIQKYSFPHHLENKSTENKLRSLNRYHTICFVFSLFLNSTDNFAPGFQHWDPYYRR